MVGQAATSGIGWREIDSLCRRWPIRTTHSAEDQLVQAILSW